MESIIHLVLEPKQTTEIVVGRGIFAGLFTGRAAVVYDRFFQERIEALLSPSMLLLPLLGGEEIKSFSCYQAIIEALMEWGETGDAQLVACGGGTVLDLAGFVAATYCRGIALSLAPTTLLSMVDGAIGGKNGINVRGMKNMVGTIYHPERVCVDLEFLDTIPEYEMACGLAEVIKHALLVGGEAFAFLESEIDAVLHKEPQATLRAVQESIEIKCAIVRESVTSPEKRHLLNLGHTVAHAIESLEEFQISHGHAFAIGLLAESFLAWRLGLLSKQDLDRIERLIGCLPLPLRLSRRYSYEQWERAFLLDKKAMNSSPRFVLLQRIGAAVITTAPTGFIREMINACCINTP